MSSSPIARIHVRGIQHNLDLARACSPHSQLLAMVKGNAYGHDMLGLASRLQRVDAFGVARVDEGLQLRAQGVKQPIIVLHGFNDSQELEACRQAVLTPTVHSQHQLDLLSDQHSRDLPVWLKLDTGMHRLGFSPLAFQAIVDSGEFNVTCILSHLANAENLAHPQNSLQLELFAALTKDLGIPRSLANSGAILGWPESHYDWIRPGIMLYGSSPANTKLADLRPAMTLTAPVLSVRAVAAGETIGYGGIWRAPENTRIAVLGIGYADGYPREVPVQMPVWINGQRRPIVGRVSMDTLMVDVGDLPIVPNERAEMWGEALPVDEVAALLGSIGYTLMSGLTARVQRELVDE